jgi:hypothetical protein
MPENYQIEIHGEALAGRTEEAGRPDWPGGPPQHAASCLADTGRVKLPVLCRFSSWSAASVGDSFAQMFGRLTRRGA